MTDKAVKIEEIRPGDEVEVIYLQGFKNDKPVWQSGRAIVLRINAKTLRIAQYFIIGVPMVRCVPFGNVTKHLPHLQRWHMEPPYEPTK